ncbi:hypothetical protein JCGZ_07289 [Jatropha curcas]|uniref:Uncharacterized protein n=1 Tax=Jatropha curcas TaxID=180498 RepID=A0A067KFI6_JATCU|nr:hypothetical protein JCGZ_07289 [Jatropha curcas]
MRDKAWCGKEGLNRGTWSASEDKILINYIKVHGEGKWRSSSKSRVEEMQKKLQTSMDELSKTRR